MVICPLDWGNSPWPTDQIQDIEILNPTIIVFLHSVKMVGCDTNINFTCTPYHIFYYILIITDRIFTIFRKSPLKSPKDACNGVTSEYHLSQAGPSTIARASLGPSFIARASLWKATSSFDDDDHKRHLTGFRSGGPKLIVSFYTKEKPNRVQKEHQRKKCYKAYLSLRYPRE